MTIPVHRVTIDESVDSFDCKSNQHLLAGMASIGKKGIPSGCHGGGCGVCKISVNSGDYHCLIMSRAHVSEDEQSRGIALACRVIPKSDLHVSVIGKMRKNLLR